MISELNIKLGGSTRCLRFNNFAVIEIAKLLFDGKVYTANPNEVLQRLEEIGADNSMLLMKYLVYGGILGNDYEVGFKATVTPQDVGKWLGSVSDDQLIGIWECFLNSMGADIAEDETLSRMPESESGLESEKKK